MELLPVSRATEVMRVCPDLWGQSLMSDTRNHTAIAQNHSSTHFPSFPTVPVWTRALAMFLSSLGTLCVFPCCHPRLRGSPAEADQKEKASTCRKEITAKSEERHTRPHWTLICLRAVPNLYSFEIWKDFKQIGRKTCHRFVIVFGLWITLTDTNTFSGFIL